MRLDHLLSKESYLAGRGIGCCGRWRSADSKVDPGAGFRPRSGPGAAGMAELRDELLHLVLEDGVRARCWVSEDATAGCVPACHPDEDPRGRLVSLVLVGCFSVGWWCSG